MTSFTRAGATERSACGMTTWRRICVKERPMERAASICPTPMVLMPVMKFSDPKDAPRSTVQSTTLGS